MKSRNAILVLAALLGLALLGVGCGPGSDATETTATSSPGENSTTQSSGTGAAVPSEAESAATGDIPDNQTFLLFHDPRAGYSIRYPEGWARKGSGADVSFQEKANVIHIAVAKGPVPSEKTAVAGVSVLKKSDPTVRYQSPEKVTLNGAEAVKISYSRLSAPDPVTGKRLQLVIDRYEYGHGGKVAVVDLATPVGVDNVDAYRMISESLQWQP